MSDLTPNPAAVVGATPPVNEAADNAAAEAVEHTPAPNVPAPPAPPVEPTDGDDRLSALETLVEGLATTVDTLARVVTQAQETDAAPTSIPWYARGGDRR